MRSSPPWFLEAIRQIRHEKGKDNCIFVHVTLVPWIAAAQELKTKPTQHSVKELRALGIQPDILLCRSERILPKEMKEKIALFCDVDEDAVVTASDVKSVYEVPVVFAAEGVDEIVIKHLDLESTAGPRNLDRWNRMLDGLRNPDDEVSIGLVGKYVEYEDSYKSLKEALIHGALAHNLRVDIHWIEAEGVDGEDWERQLEDYDAILVPGGFGKRGIEGMINAIRYARENKVPYFGICLGMQTMVIEYARNVCGLDRADSSEFDPGTPHRVIYKLRELKGVDELGGTGLRITGETPDRTYVEICEIGDHPWYLGCQFHPEFKSKPLEPHPLFRSFIGAAYENRKRRLAGPLLRNVQFSIGD